MCHTQAVFSLGFLTCFICSDNFKHLLVMMQFTVHHPAGNGEKGQEWSAVVSGAGWKQSEQQNVSSAELHGPQWGDR